MKASFAAFGVIVVFTTITTSCSQKPDSLSEADGHTNVDRSALSPDADADVQSFLDSNFYESSNIKHSFHTAAGEKIDCIDFAQQHTVRAMLGAGITIDAKALPPAPPLPAGTPAPHKPSGPTVAFNSSLDADGQARLCPDGTVAMQRPDVATIQKIGGIVAYSAELQKRPRPMDPGQCPQQHDCYHQSFPAPSYDHAAIYSNQTFSGALTIVSLHKPYIYDLNQEHTLSELWIQTNTCESWTFPYGSANTCSTSPTAPTANRAVQSLEVGWIVGNGGPPGARGSSDPYLFAFITQDGYNSAANSCFAGTPGGCCNIAGVGSDCWVAAPNAPYVVGQSLGSYVKAPNGQGPAEMAIQVWNGVLYGYNGWYVYIDGSLIGWYPISTSQPTPPTSTFAAPMLYTAQYLQAGGEVFDSRPGYTKGGPGTGSHTTTRMGSGQIPYCGYGWAAYHRNISYIDSANNYHNVVMSGVDEPDYEGDAQEPFLCGYQAGTFNSFGYQASVDSSLQRGQTNWGSSFFYGGSDTAPCTKP